MIDFKLIGKRIKSARNERGFTQEAFSEILGISTEHLSRIETGSYRPSWRLIEIISSNLDISEEVIMFGNTTPNDTSRNLANKIEMLSPQKQDAIKNLIDLLSE